MKLDEEQAGNSVKDPLSIEYAVLKLFSKKTAENYACLERLKYSNRAVTMQNAISYWLYNVTVLKVYSNICCK